MYTIRKEFSFSASHQLKGLRSDHPCARNHGHNYIVVVELKSKKLDEVGFVTDYRSLDSIKEFLDDNFDHRNLNDVVDFNPTAENIAKFLYETFKEDEDYLPELFAIEVSETPKTNARYEPDNN
jgi:6-pyruvoyltetrahydropterin/6-carboxytetrahydropterin synthase